MKHEPSPLRAEVPKLPVDSTDEELEVWLCALPPCPGIGFADDDDDEDDDAASLAEYEAGGGVPHAIVAEWLKTWGMPDHRPFWDWYELRNG